VDAGPDRRGDHDARDCRVYYLRRCAATEIPTSTSTGGAPELNPNFRWLVEQSRALGRHVMDRCNLTVLLPPRKPILPGF